MAMGIPLDEIAHTIQVALTPVFLLSGIASLLNVINARVGRVADQAKAVQESIAAMPYAGVADLLGRAARLRRRLYLLDAARGCAALAGTAICAATFALFLGALQNTAVATVLFISFGASVLLTMAALVAFFIETLLSSRRGTTEPTLLDGKP